MQGNRVHVDPAYQRLPGQEPGHEPAPVVDPAAAVPDPLVHPVGVLVDPPAIVPGDGVPLPLVVIDGVPPVAGVDPRLPDEVPLPPPAAPDHDAAGENPPGHQPPGEEAPQAHNVVEPENADVPQGQNGHPIDIRPQ